MKSEYENESHYGRIHTNMDNDWFKEITVSLYYVNDWTGETNKRTPMLITVYLILHVIVKLSLKTCCYFVAECALYMILL